MKKKCIIIGGGGHARVLIDSINASGVAEIVGILDRATKTHGKKLDGVPVLGDDTIIKRISTAHKAGYFAIGVGSTSDNTLRAKLFDMCIKAGLKPLTIVHPTAFIASSAKIGEGCQIQPLAAICAGAVLGTNVIVNTSAVVEHDCRVASHVHIATGAKLAGGVKLGEKAFVGAGSVIRQGIIIGVGAIVAAGAVVVKDVAAGVAVAGVPAEKMR